MKRLLPLLASFALLQETRASTEDSIAALTAVRREGAGNEAASASWKVVVQAGPTVLPALLAAAREGSVVAENWLRVAGDTIVDRAIAQQQPLPLDEVEHFLRDTSRDAAGRRWAFDLLARADPVRLNAIEPALSNDPVQELRRGAVQRLIEQAKATTDTAGAKAIYLQALEAARDEDQTQGIVSELKKLGAPVDLPRHFGFLTDWHVIGPFQNTGRKGFETIFPPEKEINLHVTYDGKEKPVQWQPAESNGSDGKLDFNKPLGRQKEVTGYALTTFHSPAERDAEMRLGSKNAVKVWLNGDLLFARDEYHRGQQMDQYKMKCRLKNGANTVLVKCCQNEETEEWTVEWEFQLRVCDSAGTAILSARSEVN